MSEKTCRTCDYFNVDAKKPGGPGFCDVHKDFFLPSGKCRRFKRVDSETMDDFREIPEEPEDKEDL
jgi:hypothetical protein